jgi:hypothetical protein
MAIRKDMEYVHVDVFLFMGMGMGMGMAEQSKAFLSDILESITVTTFTIAVAV